MPALITADTRLPCVACGTPSLTPAELARELGHGIVECGQASCGNGGPPDDAPGTLPAIVGAVLGTATSGQPIVPWPGAPSWGPVMERLFGEVAA